MPMDKVLLCCLRRQNVFKVLILVMATTAIVAYQPPRKSVLDHIKYWNRLRKVMYDGYNFCENVSMEYTENFRDVKNYIFADEIFLYMLF